jgi:hypothetical protein
MYGDVFIASSFMDSMECMVELGMKTSVRIFWRAFLRIRWKRRRYFEWGA